MRDGEKDVYNSGGQFDSLTQVSAGRCILPQEVPKCKRLVVETVTGFYTGESSMLAAAYLTVGGARHAFPWVPCGPSLVIVPLDIRFYAFNHFVHLYVDGPAQLQFDTAGGESVGAGSFNGNYSVSGYLVDLEAP